MNWWAIIWLVLFVVGFVTILGYEVSRKVLAARRRRSRGLSVYSPCSED